MSCHRRISSNASEDATSTIQPTTRKQTPSSVGGRPGTHDDVNGSAGVFGSPADLFHQLLDAFEQLQHQHQAQPQQGLEVIRWFTTELTPSELSLSSNRAILSQLPTDEVESLKTEMPSSKTSCRLLNLVSIASINCWDTQQMRLLLLQLPSLLQSHHTSNVFSTGSFNC